jgi:hypothetical protein
VGFDRNDWTHNTDFFGFSLYYYQKNLAFLRKSLEIGGLAPFLPHVCH